MSSLKGSIEGICLLCYEVDFSVLLLAFIAYFILFHLIGLRRVVLQSELIYISWPVSDLRP